MKLFTTLIAVIGLSVFSFAQEKYSKVKILTDAEGLNQLAALGVAVDHGHSKQNTFFISDFSASEIEVMITNGFTIEILVDDVKAYYAEHSNDPYEFEKNANCTQGPGGGGGFNPVAPANHFQNSSYAGFYKYQDMLNALDNMAALYPNLITVKAPISTFLTHENRPIYHVKISDNPSTDEASSEPNVLYTAIHHAREPMSMSQTIFYMWYLLENYATDAEVKYLVDNTQMFFVPCINPDGYIHNEVNDPTGFGMHRKNKRPVGTTNPGVDLNRNYSYGWNTTGVSTNVNNDTYPGTSAFSEPETQAIRWLVQTHDFIFASNAHSYGDLLLFPVGTTTAEFADHHDYFLEYTGHMTSFNGYVEQKSSALYPASGDSDDYMYKVDIGVGMKDTVFATTPEIGDDFWPSQSAIVPTCLEMIFPNLTLAHMALKYHLLSDADPATLSSTSGNFTHDIRRLGQKDGPVTVSIEPLLNIQSVGAPVVYNLGVRESSTGTISYALNPSIAFGDEVKYVLNLEYGTWTHRDTITKTFGAVTLQFSEDATTATNWTGTWSTTGTQFVSPSKSFTDSPSGDYLNNATATYEFDQDIDLTIATAAQASFYARWEIEEDYDYTQFQVSTDNGATWIGQCGNYTTTGTSANGSVQPNNKPVYEGFQTSWVLEEVNLSDYLGEVIRVRFILEADGGVKEDGFYFDDFQIGFNVQDTSTSNAGINEFSFNVKTIPNPANDQAFISLSKAINGGSMMIYDQAGLLVETQEINELTNKLIVNTAKFNQGVYLVVVEQNGVAAKPVKLVVVH